MYRAYFEGLKAVAQKRSAIDIDYQAILDYATAEGFSLPSLAQQELQNTLVLALKSSGAWSKLRFFAVHASGGDEDFALIDWKNPGVRIHTKINSPIYNSLQGFTGDGNDAGINYDYNPVNENEGSTLSIGSYYDGIESAFQRPLHDNGSGATRRTAIITDNRGGNTPDLTTRMGSLGNDEVAAAGTLIFGGHIHVNINNPNSYKVFKNGLLLNTINNPFNSYINANLIAMGSSLDLLTVRLNYAAGDLENEIVDFSDAINNYINAL